MESKVDIIAIDLDAPIEHVEGIVLTEQQRNALAERIDRVIRERRRIGIARRMQARLRQLRSIERARDGFQTSVESCCETPANAA